jgi:hypothetical protein
MTRYRFISIVCAIAVVLSLLPASRAEAPGAAPDLTEVYNLIRAHLAGLSEGEANREAVQALISAFAPRVSLATENPPTNSSESSLVSKVSVFDDNIAYVRLGKVETGLAPAVRSAWESLTATNRPKGLVLDLRYAGGGDYGAAASVADLFLRQERALLDWGKGAVRSQAKANAISVPVALLVNRQTAGAAEALAAVMRDAGTALVFGGRTAGQAMILTEYPLSNGQRLRIATQSVRLGDGSAVPIQGVEPDITVQVNPRDERAYYADAFQSLAPTNLTAGGGLGPTNLAGGTNRLTRRPRFNEAELVRERREGPIPDQEGAAMRDAEPEKPQVLDPALARALDVLKGLAVVRRVRP